MGKALKKEIREHLLKTLGMTKGSIAALISEIKYDYPHLTPAAAAQVLAKRKNKSIMRFLNDDDKKTLATVGTMAVPPVLVRQNTVKSGKHTPPPILVFPSTDKWHLPRELLHGYFYIMPKGYGELNRSNPQKKVLEREK
jgi:hypothetical protein